MKNFTLLAVLMIFGIGAGAQCTAGFNAAAGSSTGEIDFTNTSSTGTLLSYTFNYGDGAYDNIAAGATITHTYTANGAYAACIYVTSIDSSCYTSYCDSVTVTGITTGCNASFYTILDSTGSSSVVWLVDMSTGTGLSYFWDFGDGTTSVDMYPTHDYGAVGTYVICLTIDDGAGCTDTFCDSITVTTKAVGFTLNVIADESSLGFEEIAVFTELSIYPNPTEGITNLSINSQNDSEIQVQILNINGQLVSANTFAVTGGTNVLTLDTENMAKGVYFVQIISEDLNTIEYIQLIKK